MTAPAAGSLGLPEGADVVLPRPLPADARVAIVAADYHASIVSRLLEAAVATIEAAGVRRDRITVATAPGAFELPLVAAALAGTGGYAAVVALGCVIRGGTPHFEYVCAEAARGVADAARRTGVPIAFGVLTCDTMEQAEERAGGAHGNKGEEAAAAALHAAGTLAAIGA
jgi:6,7-dimethyl-8-ribityllumazine synthase